MVNSIATQETINVLNENRTLWTNRLKENLTNKWVVKVNICYTASINTNNKVILNSRIDTVPLEKTVATRIFETAVFSKEDGTGKKSAEALITAEQYFTEQLNEIESFLKLLGV